MRKVLLRKFSGQTTNPYDILGIAKTATLGEIKSAYRSLTKKFHPDVNPGAEAKFREIRESVKKSVSAGMR